MAARQPRYARLRNALVLIALALSLVGPGLVLGTDDAAATSLVAEPGVWRWAADFLARCDAFGP